jgi:alkanesulfonate monooxygenase SsuD/methylene tetrahydromethanopterin reductase-like flavin-dependent oxidoreductase (luciferase family)
VVRLTGELADGWLPFLYPRSRLADGMDRLQEGMARGARAGRLPAICPMVPAVVAADAAAAREGAAWFVSFYLTTMGPLYRSSLARQGFGRDVEAILAAATPGAKGVVPASAEGLMEELVVWGTPAEARERLGRWHAAGAEQVLLLLRPNLRPEELVFTLDAFRPMLQSSTTPS